MTRGVPQGSILGPLLFGVYTKDQFASVLQRCSSQSYVDDTKFIIPFQLKDTVHAVSDLSNDFFQIAEWCSKNYLLLKPSKAKLVMFRSRQMRSKLGPFSLHFMGKELFSANTFNSRHLSPVAKIATKPLKSRTGGSNILPF